MNLRKNFSYIPRRTFLAGALASSAGMFVRPLFAAAAGASPTRLLIVHRPCGTYPPAFFPQSGDATTFPLPMILQPFAPVQANMTILNGVYCPRDHNWAGDQHAAGLITMMTGKRPIAIPGTDVGGDPNAKNQMAAGPSIDQVLLADPKSGLGGTAVGSIQSTAYGPSSSGLPNFRVMSYNQAGALFAESRPGTVLANVFGAGMNLSPAELQRMQVQQKSVLDFVNKDLTRLQGQVPASQIPKLQAHLDGIRTLETRIAAQVAQATGGGPACKPPMQAALPTPMGDATIDEAQHQICSQNQLGIILTAFQCDLTRVATFTFADGNSALRFSKIIPGFADGGGHHAISHIQTATGEHAQIDQFYAQQLSTLLQAMKATPDGNGTLLDHTLIVYLNECSYGWSHSIDNMPVLMFGGQNLNAKLKLGQHIKYGMRYMNDVWAAVSTAFGSQANTFGDTAFSTGAVTGLFG
jgi:Protein of unknown function (DUF1552)